MDNVPCCVLVVRVVFWNDANGSTFYLKPVGGDLLESHDLVIEDCTVRGICQKSQKTLCTFFRWFMHGGCCHALEVEEVVCSTCEAMEEVEVAVA